MCHLHRLALLSTTAATLVIGGTSPALAQAAQAMDAAGDPATAEARADGLRTLTWPGRPAVSPARSYPTSAAPTPRPAIIARGGYQAPAPVGITPPAPAAPRQGLTPASAWLSPRVTPQAAAPATEEILAPAPAASPTGPAQAAPATADPLAPRRDAPIFRMGEQGQAAPASAPAPAPAPAPYGQARYYSVHRQYGRQPDAPPMLPPVYLDALPRHGDRHGGIDRPGRASRSPDPDPQR
ncbi:hypothetical protein [Brevundimonas vesicularis]|uniref:hypothetical protein n=1 Tax=Brevundimonas vesicularis TaxID=41276 RepID=UPI0038D472D7